MIKVQIVSSKNVAWYRFCSKKDYKNKNMIINKISFENSVITVFYQKLLATIIYINKNITKAQARLRGQVEANQPHYYTSISMITRTKAQKLG